MEAKIILNLAMSLDGYIAKEDDSYDWIVGSGNSELNTQEHNDYKAFLRSVDIVVMGKRCYDLGMHREFEDKHVYVLTHQALSSTDHLIFGDESLVQTLLEQKKEGKSIYIFGGGQLVDLFIKNDLIDEYIIGIIPIILGKGIPLFLGNTPEIPLYLESILVEDGITIQRYRRR